MDTLIDFLTRVKGIEYLISVLAITGFVVYVEVLKPRPFRKLARTVRDDLDYLRATGYRSALRTAGRIAAAPFIGLAYVLSLPFLFAFTFAREAAGLAADGLSRALGTAGRGLAFGWRPTEAYLGGRRGPRGKKEKAAPEPPEAPAERDEKREA